MKTYDTISRAVFSRPWAILPSTLATIVDILRFRAAGGEMSAEEVALRLETAATNAGPRGGNSRTGAVAIIPLYGVIMPRAGMMETSGGTSIERFRANFRAAMADTEVGSIVLDVDSPGGVIDGVPDMAEEVRAARGSKPVVAIANTLMASAAYWIACGAQEVWTLSSALVGSIGVWTAHDDLSAFYESKGIKTTLISAGKYKVEGNELGPLTDEARASLQARVDDVYSMFSAGVAKGRGVPLAQVRGGLGEGRVLLGSKAVAEGLADRVGTLDDAIVRAAKLGAANARATGPAAVQIVDVPPAVVAAGDATDIDHVADAAGDELELGEPDPTADELEAVIAELQGERIQAEFEAARH